MNIKEQIRKEIDKRYAEYRAKMKTDDFTYYEGMADALDLFEQYIDTFPEQPEVDLDEEIDTCWQNWLSPSNQKEVEGVLPKTEFATYARHFAEWGRNQVLQELYKGKIKPFDKISVTWLDDELKDKEDK